MDKEKVNTGAAADGELIADAIYAGLTEVAGAIRELAKAIAGEEEAPASGFAYLDTPRGK